MIFGGIKMNFLSLGLLIISFLFTGCNQFVDVQNGEPTRVADGLNVDDSKLLLKTGFGEMSLRRLSRFEILSSMEMIFGQSFESFRDLLPEDVLSNENPFDNMVENQNISQSYIVSIEQFADSVTEEIMKDKNILNSIANCTPSNSDDFNCFSQFVYNLGMQMIRRPLNSSDADEILAFHEFSVKDSDFYSGISWVIKSFIYHPEFLYRIEKGQYLSGNFLKLNSYELASRLSFTIWGTGPDSELFSLAESGALEDPNVRVQQVERLFEDEKALKNLDRYHAQWLGYYGLTLPSQLESDMKNETLSLLNRIIIEEDQSWLNIFTFDETYLTPELAAHYDWTQVSAEQWTAYTGTIGGGILSHGQFLAQGAKFNDTSPTVRGNRLFQRVLCTELGEPPNEADIDTSPIEANPNLCKSQAYAETASDPKCATCHNIIDSIGFGLENFGPLGEYRTQEVNNTSCTIDDSGSLGGQDFNGPRGLGQTLASNPGVSLCAVKRLHQFIVGRVSHDSETALIEDLNIQLEKAKSLKELLKVIFGTPAIAYRVVE